jgi:hypothetical protein
MPEADEMIEPLSDVPREPTGINSSGAAEVPYLLRSPARMEFANTSIKTSAAVDIFLILLYAFIVFMLLLIFFD